jgi:hypothetical protein
MTIPPSPLALRPSGGARQRPGLLADPWVTREVTVRDMVAHRIGLDLLVRLALLVVIAGILAVYLLNGGL